MDFRRRVLDIVRSVPPGRVVTYGQVALLAGSPRAARQVASALRAAPEGPELPWHRVINASGGLSTYKIGIGEWQRALLEAEGVAVVDGRVDLARFGWDPGEPDAG